MAGAVISADGARSAANAQERASQNSVQEQQREYDQSRDDYAPWRAAGTNALNELQNPNQYFTASPDYNFVRTEGDRGVQASAAARGGAFSGNALKALADYNSNLASGEFSNWWNRQAGLAGVGQQATNATTQAGLTTSSNISNALTQQGDARASGIINSTNAFGGAVNQLGGIAGYYGSRSPSSSAPTNYLTSPMYSSGYTPNYTPPNGDQPFFIG